MREVYRDGNVTPIEIDVSIFNGFALSFQETYNGRQDNVNELLNHRQKYFISRFGLILA